MTLPTLLDIRTKIDNDLDLTNETMISAAEKIGYINQAIDEAKQHVITIYEDYFLQSANLALVTGTQDYDLPSNVYAHKIRKIIYDDGNTKYIVKRMRKFEDIPYVQTTDYYRYRVIMNSSGAFKLRLWPAAQETSSTNVTIWFIGEANTLAVDTDIMNIPEAYQFVVAKSKLECARKEGHPAQSALEMEVERQRVFLVDTLTAMVPDEDNTILPDMSFYTDFDPMRRRW